MATVNSDIIPVSPGVALVKALLFAQVHFCIIPSQDLRPNHADEVGFL